MRRRKSRTQQIFDQVCIHLIFLLAAFLVLLLGIRAAGRTIEFAQSEKIEIINNLVDGLSQSSKLKVQGKRLQMVVYKYLEALVEAVADFEFIPRNDITVLTQIINALPEETGVLSFSYHGRNLSIRTVQPTARQALEMVENLEKRAEGPDAFEKIVYSYYFDNSGRCIAEITMVAHPYEEYDLKDELEKRFLPDPVVGESENKTQTEEE